MMLENSSLNIHKEKVVFYEDDFSIFFQKFDFDST